MEIVVEGAAQVAVVVPVVVTVAGGAREGTAREAAVAAGLQAEARPDQEPAVGVVQVGKEAAVQAAVAVLAAATVVAVVADTHHSKTTISLPRLPT